MKKLFVILILSVLAACNNDWERKIVPETTKADIPVDTVKVDTVVNGVVKK